MKDIGGIPILSCHENCRVSRKEKKKARRQAGLKADEAPVLLSESKELYKFYARFAVR